MVDKIEDFFSGFFKALEDDFPDLENQKFYEDYINLSLKEKILCFGEFISNLGLGLVEGFKRLLNDIWNLITLAFDKLVSVSGYIPDKLPSINDVYESLVSIYESAKKAIFNLYDNSGEIYDAVIGLFNDIKRLAKLIVDYAPRIGKKLIELAQKVSGSFSDFGYSIGQSVVRFSSSVLKKNLKFVIETVGFTVGLFLFEIILFFIPGLNSIKAIGSAKLLRGLKLTTGNSRFSKLIVTAP